MSSDLCKRRRTCRLCDSADVTSVVNLTPTPPANAFVAEAELGAVQPTFPLELFFCEACGHVQLLDVVDPAHLFRNYVYVSGTSPSFVKHFEDYAKSCIERFRPAAGALVWHRKDTKASWHWVVYWRGFRGPVVLDPKKALRTHTRTDFGRIKPKWFISIIVPTDTP